ncbi:Short-chain dehydrogenase [Paenibacillus sp. UNCCL117]|uniref:SDR family oxidoreductase n=1 Tax=unclassified Paenibacillus TaxID=185978 RepID=UPI00088E1EA7|nr:MULTISPECIES: SDR family oxidoreductase [unclassified Paenibacillus]SDC65013.1 Short-chain dehydrogenase [Paenibacillus sp. cl123]SFW22656.1 Short-chain dehydrogenase [Paenibacillus sp. UNCCL117]
MIGEGHKVALVTGASSGFGLLTSAALARKGYIVIATMRNPAASGALLEQAERDGVLNRIETMTLDVTDFSAIEAVVRTVRERYGQIDVLVNNAGFAVGGFIEDVPMEAFRSQLETNLFGLMAITKEVLPIMRERRSGYIVNIGSMSGRFAFPGYGAYAVSKFAVEGFSESLRLELKPLGVHVVLLEPGAYRTAIWQKGFASIHTTEASSYRSRLERILRITKRSAEAAPNPQEVADTIVSIVESPKPRFRYPLGKGSSLALLAKAIVPWAWYERLVERLLK